MEIRAGTAEERRKVAWQIENLRVDKEARQQRRTASEESKWHALRWEECVFSSGEDRRDCQPGDKPRITGGV